MQSRMLKLEEAIRSATTDAIISDLAQLIKHASRLSLYNINNISKVNPNTNTCQGFLVVAMLLMEELHQRQALPDKKRMHAAQLALYDPIVIAGEKHEHDDVEKNAVFYDHFMQRKLDLNTLSSPNINGIVEYYKEDQHRQKNNSNNSENNTLSKPVIFKVIDVHQLPTWGPIKKALQAKQIPAKPSISAPPIGEMDFDLLYDGDRNGMDHSKQNAHHRDIDQRLQLALAVQAEERRQIDIQVKVDRLIKNIDQEIQTYINQGRINRIGRLFNQPAQHKQYAFEIMKKLNEINDSQANASDKLKHIINALSDAQHYLQDQNSVRLLVIINKQLAAHQQFQQQINHLPAFKQ